MKVWEATKNKIDCGNPPRYITNRGKLLWTDTEHYDCYSSNASVTLRDAYGRFWGYSDDPKVKLI